MSLEDSRPLARKAIKNQIPKSSGITIYVDNWAELYALLYKVAY